MQFVLKRIILQKGFRNKSPVVKFGDDNVFPETTPLRCLTILYIDIYIYIRIFIESVNILHFTYIFLMPSPFTTFSNSQILLDKNDQFIRALLQ